MSEALSAIRNGEKLTTRQEASLILKLSLPAILVQISSIIMQYIDASAYFLIYALSIPVRELLLTSQRMIQSSGNIRVPSILNVVMCALDVVFNALLIPRFGIGRQH